MTMGWLRRVLLPAPPHLRGRVPVDCGVGVVDERYVVVGQEIQRRPVSAPPRFPTAFESEAVQHQRLRESAMGQVMAEVQGATRAECEMDLACQVFQVRIYTSTGLALTKNLTRQMVMWGSR